MSILETDQALEALHRRTAQGDAAAATRLGARLLIGKDAPLAPQEGLAHLQTAAERGGAEALEMLATLAGTGFLLPQSWTDGLDYLRRAAALGGDNARGQLQLLAAVPNPGSPEDPDTWRRLAEAVDIAALTRPPERRALCEQPRVRLAEGFASTTECDWLRRRAQGRMRPAMMYDGTAKIEQVDPHRTCSDYQFDILNADLVLLLLRERISALVKLPPVAMEPPRIFHYALGEQIKPHYDRCGDSVGGYGKDTAYLGDRIVTLLIYLNDGYEGGDLDFPKVGFRCKGRKGDAVYFAHVDAAGKPDPLSLHAGLTITAGEKWVFSQWIHDRPFGVAASSAP